MIEAGGRLTREQCRDSGLAATLVILLIAYFGGRSQLVLPAIIVMVAAMVAPALFRPWAFVWWGLARILATFASAILLTVIYFVLVVPIGLVRRLLGADAMRERQWKGQGSVLVERDGSYRAEDLEVPY